MVDKINQLASLLDSLGIVKAKQSKILLFVENVLRSTNLTKTFVDKADKTNFYSNQILNMFQKHPGLSDDIYKNYILTTFNEILKN